MFGSGVEITFQNVFHLEMHYNNIYFKKLFLTLIHQNNPKVQKKMNLKKNLKIMIVPLCQIITKAKWYEEITVNQEIFHCEL